MDKIALKLFRDIHTDLPREAPGSRETTLELLKTFFVNHDGIPARGTAVDVACGPGASTALLREFLPAGWKIVAIDLEESYLKKVKEKVPNATTQRADMNDLEIIFDKHSVDLILCEGASYILNGTPEVARRWHCLLKPNGALLVNDCCWTTSDIPTEVLEFWKEGYPNMLTTGQCLERLKYGTGGYEVLAHFNCTQQDIDNYYVPMEGRIKKLVADSPDLAGHEVIKSHQLERDLWNSKTFSYVQFVLRKDSSKAQPNWWRNIPVLVDNAFRMLNLSKHRKPLKIADIGCGQGEASSLFSDRGFQVLGVDSNQDSIDKLSKRNMKNAVFECCDLNNDDILRHGSFDGLWSCFVAAYFTNEKLGIFLNKCASIVKPGGFFILTEINGLMSPHRPVSRELQQAFETLEKSLFLDIGYDCFAGEKMKDFLPKDVEIVKEIQWQDGEISFKGPVSEPALQSWRNRFNRPLKALMNYVNGNSDEYERLTNEFLKALENEDHTCEGRGITVLLLRKTIK